LNYSVLSAILINTINISLFGYWPVIKALGLKNKNMKKQNKWIAAIINFLFQPLGMLYFKD